METKIELDSVTLAKLHDLVRINIDSDEGFTEASEVIKNKTIAALFLDLASQRKRNGQELQEFVAWNSEKAEVKGSYIAAMHRAWIDLRGMMSGDNSHAILSEAERGEDAIKGAYEDAMPSVSGNAVHDVLSRQYIRVKEDHDRIKSLRDTFAVR
jgi:uncharacterized protein (TIGR02284 family)